MSRESSIHATEKFGELVNGGRFDAFPEVVAPDCHDHDPAPGQHMGPEGYKAFFTELRTAFPDMQVEVKKLVADNLQLVFAGHPTDVRVGPPHRDGMHWQACVTAMVPGIAGALQQIRILLSVEDGKVGDRTRITAEHWCAADKLEPI